MSLDTARVVTMTGENEQRLMLLQATMNSRKKGIATVLERFRLFRDVAWRTVPIPQFP